MAPSKTPRDIVARFSTESAKVIASADIRERFIQAGLEPIGNTPEEFGRFIRDETAKYAKVVKAAGIKPQ